MICSCDTFEGSWDYWGLVVVVWGGRTGVDARKSRLISPERRCRARPWRTASPRRSTAWRDPRCPGLCAKPQLMNRHPRRKNTWNVSYLSIKKIYKSVYLSRVSILLSIHPPSYSSTTRPCATAMIVVASSIHPSNGFYYVHGGLPLPHYVFPYIPTIPACHGIFPLLCQTARPQHRARGKPQSPSPDS